MYNKYFISSTWGDRDFIVPFSVLQMMTLFTEVCALSCVSTFIIPRKPHYCNLQIAIYQVYSFMMKQRDHP